MKKILLVFILFCAVTVNADPLWNKAVDIYGRHIDNHPDVYKAYILMGSGGSNSSEIWEEYKSEGGEYFRKVLKVKKNGVDVPIPAEAQDKWFPVTNSKKDNKGEYKGLGEIFMARSQNVVAYNKTGKSKIIYGISCAEYNFTFKKNRNGKIETVTGKAYLDMATGAPYEIRRHNTSQYMKGSPDSYVQFSYDGNYLYPRYFILIMNINFMGQQSNMTTEVKMDYKALE